MHKTTLAFGQFQIDTMLEELSFYSLSLKENKKLFPNFQRASRCHLQGNVRGLMSLIVWPCWATREKLQGDGWNLHTLVSVKGGLPFVDLDGLLDLSPVVVVLPSYYSNIVHFNPMTRVSHVFCNGWCCLLFRRVQCAVQYLQCDIVQHNIYNIYLDICIFSHANIVWHKPVPCCIYRDSRHKPDQCCISW